VKKLECSKQAFIYALKNSAWDNEISYKTQLLLPIFGLQKRLRMIDRGGRGHSYPDSSVGQTQIGEEEDQEVYPSSIGSIC
jgi:hypothetical protein